MSSRARSIHPSSSLLQSGPAPGRTSTCLAFVAGLTSIALLSACGSTSTSAPVPLPIATGAAPIAKYEPPAAGGTARLVLRAVVPTGDAYVVNVLAEPEHCEKPLMIGSGNAVQHPDTTTLVADQPVTLEFHLMTQAKACRSRWTFTPSAGKSYLLTGLGVATGCLAVISDMSDVDHIKPEPGALHRNPDSSTSCVSIARSKPMPVAASASAASAGEAVLREGATSSDLKGLIAP